MASAISHLLWVGIDKFGNYAVSFIIGIILARLLGPEAFGVIGIITIFMAIANVMAIAGLRDAMIRKKNPSPQDYATLQITNLVISILTYLLFFVSAPILSSFFEISELTDFLRVYSLVLIIQSLAFAKGIKLTKSFQFRKITLISFCSTLVSGAVAIYLALQGFGVWSLVLQGVMNWGIRVILYFYFDRSFELGFNVSSFRELWKFGSKMMVIEVVNELFQNANRAFIGKVFTTTELGFFTKAESFKNILSKNLSFAFVTVYFPQLSELQDDLLVMKQEYRKMIQNLTLVVFVSLLTLAGSSKNFILVLIGAEWEGAVPVLRLLCFAGLAKPLISLNTSLLKVFGYTGTILRTQILSIILICINLFIAYFFGIYSLIVGLIIHSFVIAVITAFYSNRFLKYGALNQLYDILPGLLLGLLVLVITFALDYNFTPCPAVLIGQMLISTLLVASISLLFPRSHIGGAGKSLINFVKRKLE